MARNPTVPDASPADAPPRDRGCGCLVLGEYLAILLLIGAVTIVALLTLGGGWGDLLSALGPSPTPTILP